MTNDEAIELDLHLAEALAENRMLRRQRDAAMEEALRLRHTLEHIYAKAVLAIQTTEPIEHGDKDAY